jgi:predicted Rdx family selenoprotein
VSKAVSLADELREAFGVNAKLIPGYNGIFDVVIDGQRVFSRSEAGRFPELGEISGKLK